MSVEGSLQFYLFRELDKIKDVAISSSRPLQASRVFIGKTSREIIQIMPLIYYVCGVAQSTAATMAFEQAMGIKVNNNTESARMLLVKMETLREHLWRIFLDWSDKLGESKNEKTTRHLQQLFAQSKQAVFSDASESIYIPGALAIVEISSLRETLNEIKLVLETNVFSLSVENWLEISSIKQLSQWQQSCDTTASRMLLKAVAMENGACSNGEKSVQYFLPELDADRLHQCFDSEDADNYIARPHWNGQVYETSSLSRQQKHPLVSGLLALWGNGVATRIVARLTELAKLLVECDQLIKKLSSARFKKPIAPTRLVSRPQKSGIGMAQLEAARGRLVHRVELIEGYAKRYQILAPTEWNFHPKGVAVNLLKNLRASSDSGLVEQADLIISSIDPCVSYSLELQ